ncbi:unnamed protein product [Phyllotreta striolata]|uniref:Uncharacterized protein n=1 Tax=Phyllotreta striolata TaxID=444603 RepID=A0A9N9XLG6_PHYSR|nr:unnamed protein product [Phyllotreta striolata]
MKGFTLLVAISAVSYASALEDQIKDVNVIDSGLFSPFESGAGIITAIVNDYVDKLLPNIAKFAIKHELDPAPLGNIVQNFLVAKINLSDGQLHGISGIERNGDVMVSYSNINDNRLSLQLPLKFSNLSFTYNYDIQVLIPHIIGELEGVIENFKFYLELEFDFKNFKASIAELKTTDSGHISFITHGNITDFIFNILSQFVTTILHPLIQGIIEGIIKGVANNIVNDVNEIIQTILNGSTEIQNNIPEYYPLILNKFY